MVYLMATLGIIYAALLCYPLLLLQTLCLYKVDVEAKSVKG